jgi:hypothetical protein
MEKLGDDVFGQKTSAHQKWMFLGLSVDFGVRAGEARCVKSIRGSVLT